MMNIQEYIASGILQEYCLGLLSGEEKAIVETNCRLYPEIQAELEACRAALLHHAQTPDPSLRKSIWNLLENVNREEKGLEGRPLLNRFSEKDTWLRWVQPFLPAVLDRDLFVRVIRDDGQCRQMILWSKVDIPEEEHADVQESFMVLEGECACYVGEEVFRLCAGGYFEIPMHTRHSVKILTPEVLAVVQRMNCGGV